MRLALALVLAAFTTTALAAQYELDGQFVRVPGTVAFETGSDRLLAESDAALENLKGYLEEKSYISLLRIEGHTDSQGAEAFNLKISQGRAMAIAKWLVAHGVDCKRLIPVGFGSTKPVAANDTAENRALNRRMDFVNAALRGRAIGGMPVDGGGAVAGDPCGR